ncbi:hypothetical protein [Alicyclobacillus fodiniaquatilis]|uniref:Uncharacterized protein n=1 Tax=Alicyclobacillus fodiniaquatilis TaxID=1661150 RepID=A0ABW4JJ97_9BACL
MKSKKLMVISSALGALVLVGGVVTTFASITNRAPITTAKTTTSTTQAIPTVTKTLSLSQKEQSIPNKNADKYFKIPCVDSSGKKFDISVKNAPVMFVSAWDSPIVSQLEQDKHSIKTMPVFVVVQAGPHKSSSQEISDVKKLLQQHGVTGSTVLALDDNQQFPHEWITGDPDTYVWKNSHLMEIPGPLKSNEVSQWSKILG